MNGLPQSSLDGSRLPGKVRCFDQPEGPGAGTFPDDLAFDAQALEMTSCRTRILSGLFQGVSGSLPLDTQDLRFGDLMSLSVGQLLLRERASSTKAVVFLKRSMRSSVTAKFSRSGRSTVILR